MSEHLLRERSRVATRSDRCGGEDGLKFTPVSIAQGTCRRSWGQALGPAIAGPFPPRCRAVGHALAWPGGAPVRWRAVTSSVSVRFAVPTCEQVRLARGRVADSGGGRARAAVSAEAASLFKPVLEAADSLPASSGFDQVSSTPSFATRSPSSRLL